MSKQASKEGVVEGTAEDTSQGHERVKLGQGAGKGLLRQEPIQHSQMTHSTHNLDILCFNDLLNVVILLWIIVIHLGHRLVIPRRVVVARNLKNSGSALMKFHRMERLHVVGIAAGMIPSLALTDNGMLFYGVSSDPDLKCQQLYFLNGRKIVNISAGKYWSAAVTSTGDIYMWDGKKGKDRTPAATRLHGAKRATKVSVGETHLLIVGSIYHPAYPLDMNKDSQKQNAKVTGELGELDDGFMFNDVGSDSTSPALQNEDAGNKLAPSLESLCEKVAADCLVEPQRALQLLEIADSFEAENLWRHCEVHDLR